MICPKCSHDNSLVTSCESCGVIFEKYFQQRQRQRDLEMEQWEREDRLKRKKILFGGGVILGGALLGLYFILSEPQVDDRMADINRSAAQITSASQPQAD